MMDQLMKLKKIIDDYKKENKLEDKIKYIYQENKRSVKCFY